MSVEQMLKQTLIDADKAAENARSAAESHNAYIQSQVGTLRELVAKLEACEDEGELEGLEEEASELAEELEIEFIYTRKDGKVRRYYPQAFWEPSGGCEWVESAEYGIHYGWNI